MAFHALIQVSLTHSSSSCAFASRPRAMERQYAPYFAAVSWMASSLRSQYRSMMAVSSMALASFSRVLPFQS